MIGALLALHVAAGGVVDASASSEVGATHTELNQAVDDFLSFRLRPGLRFATESDQLAFSTGYAPALSLNQRLATAGDASSYIPGILHNADARGEARFNQRLALRAEVTASAGEADPGSAQALFQNSGGRVLALETVPTTGIGGRVGMSSQLVRRLGLESSAGIEYRRTQLIAASGTRTVVTTTPGADVLMTYQLTRNDTVLGGLNAAGAVVEGAGSFAGAGPIVGYRRQLGARTGLELVAGAGAYSADDEEFNPFFAVMPTVSARANTIIDLAGEGALEAGLAGGIAIVNDPLGTLLEQRGSAAVNVGWRIMRGVALRGDVSAFSPFLNYGANALEIAFYTVGERIALSWEVSDNVALEGSLLGTQRGLVNGVQNDITGTIALTAHAPVWHSGARPGGSSLRVGRDVGVAQVGRPPPPGATTIREVEPLPVVDEAPPPPELVPPRVMEAPPEEAIVLPGQERPALKSDKNDKKDRRDRKDKKDGERGDDESDTDGKDGKDKKDDKDGKGDEKDEPKSGSN